jgi:Txe/YoeB family toxin of Txe-Axe toxin-antitoxin module
MKSIFVAFASKKLKNDFELLKQGKFEDKQLYSFIERAINDLKQNPGCGTKIPKKVWPKEYNVTNLWKYNLPNAWRMIYTIESNEVKIISFILEWFTHKNYEKRFKYGKF